MAGMQVVVRKQTLFQGRDEEFTNVYYFGDGSASIEASTEDCEAVLDWVIAREKTIFTSTVAFLGGYCRNLGVTHKPVSGPAKFTKELSGSHVGAMTDTANFYRECAVMLRWHLGGRRFLRSFYHTQNSHGYNLNGSPITVPGSLTPQLTSFANDMLNTVTAGYRRRSPRGEVPSSVIWHPTLEHRQFHEGRKRKKLVA